MTTSPWPTTLHPLIILAPMDGYTDSAMRRVCKSVNPNIVLFTEFTSADGLHHGAQKLQEKLVFCPDEKPIIAQIFGKNTETFVTAAKYIEEQGFAGIDLNMGCPAKTVVKSEHGIALRKKPQLAASLVKAVADATSLPISVKTRLGWDDFSDLIEFGKRIEAAGASLISVHARTYKQGYGPGVNYQPIYELKKKLSIPVIGNGDIASLEDGYSRLKNLDGFMIGRAAIGNPWVFNAKQPATFADKIPLIEKHARLLIGLKGEKRALLEIRKHLLAYVKGIPHATNYRSQLVRVSSFQQTHDILKEIAESI